MWLAEKLVNDDGKTNIIDAAGVASSSNALVTATGRDGKSKMSIAAPYGIMYSPPVNDLAVMIKADSGDICLGTIVKANEINNLPHAGEIYLFSDGGAYIRLLNSGDIEVGGQIYISGDVNVTGDVNIDGNLYVNGKQLA